MAASRAGSLAQPELLTTIEDPVRATIGPELAGGLALTPGVAAGAAAFLVALIALAVALTALRRLNVLRAHLNTTPAEPMDEPLNLTSALHSPNSDADATQRNSLVAVLEDVRHLKAANAALRDENASLKDRLGRLESLLDERRAGEPVSAGPAQPAFESSPPTPGSVSPRSASEREVDGVRERTRALAERAAELFDHSFELQDYAEKNGLVFMKVVDGGLRPIELRASHNDRWMLAVPDRETGLACLHFGPRVARERIKLRVNSRFLAACEPFFEVNRSSGRLDLDAPAVIAVTADGADIVRKGALSA